MIGKEADKAEKKERETIFLLYNTNSSKLTTCDFSSCLETLQDKIFVWKKGDDAGLVFASHKQEKDLGRKN